MRHQCDQYLLRDGARTDEAGDLRGDGGGVAHGQTSSVRSHVTSIPELLVSLFTRADLAKVRDATREEWVTRRIAI
jgi:hypothetical protein